MRVYMIVFIQPNHDEQDATQKAIFLAEYN